MFKKRLKRNSNSLNYIENGVFTKIYPNEIREELEKNQKIFVISLENDFLFPEIINYSIKQHRIDFKLINNATSLRDLFFENKHIPNKKFILQLFFESGRTLACIHKNLISDTKKDWNPHNLFCNPDESEIAPHIPHAILHGDYTTSNILVEKEGKIVIIDPSPNYHNTFFPFEYAPIYVDIGNFLSGIEGLFPYKEFFFINKKYIKLCKDSFVKGYEKEYGDNLNCGLVGTYTKHCAKNYLLKNNGTIIYYIKYAFFLLKKLR